MVLLDLVIRLVVAVVGLLVVAGVVCLDRSELGRPRLPARRHLREVGPYLGLLAGILAVNRVARDAGPVVSWALGVNISGLIYAVEGNLVGTVQAIQGPTATAVLSFVYLPGYIALLSFPFVAYAALGELRSVQLTATAYAIDYAVGLVCYLAFVSYGPRNVIPDLVAQPLFSTYPEAQLLTGQLNANTNVFPSLHAALAVTVAVVAVRTRRTVPRWAAVAVPTAAAVLFATVYLGIHWGIDVLAGALLGVTSVRLAERWVDRNRADDDGRNQPPSHGASRGRRAT